MSDEDLRNTIIRNLTCRIDKRFSFFFIIFGTCVLFPFVCCLLVMNVVWNCRENCSQKMDKFLKRCFYHSGQYSSEEHFLELDNRLREKEVNVVI